MRWGRSGADLHDGQLTGTRTKPDLPAPTQLYPPHRPHQGLCLPPNFLRGLSFSQKPNLTVIPLLGDEETQKQVAQKDSDGGGT